MWAPRRPRMTMPVIAMPMPALRRAPPAPAAPPGRPAPGKGRWLVPWGSSIIAGASGKGGVGQSTTAVNLAVSMAAEGLKVGLLDADIYAPSLPQMLGTRDRPRATQGRIIP